VPLTFPTHPVAVIPLKLWRPTWFDGVALVLGSVAPDLAYAFDGSGLPVWPFSHQLSGLVGWCLPIALAGTWAVRRAAPVVAAHLPSGGLDLRAYGALSVSRHPWWITISSALLGAASHLALDWLEMRVPVIEVPVHVAGLLGLLLLASSVGGRRLLQRWHGDPPFRRPRPGIFWPIAVAVTLAGTVGALQVRDEFHSHTTGVRLLCAAAGLLLASAAVAVVAHASRPGKAGTGPPYDRLTLGRWTDRLDR
jgi:Domain of unknown function (DUF4184)